MRNNSKMDESSFGQLSKIEMDDIQGGKWKLFGKEYTAVDGTSCFSETAGCSQDWEKTVYVFGIKTKKIVSKGCSNMLKLGSGDTSGCENCVGCP
jgi:hypothetical protein